MDMVRNILMGLGCLGLLYLGSCTVVGIGGAIAVQQAASPENLDRLSREADEREIQIRNAQMNEEAGRAADYGEPGVPE